MWGNLFFFIKKSSFHLRFICNKNPANLKTFCHFLWHSVFIDEKGDIYTCCHLKPGKIGNIYRNKLASIWKKSFSLKKFRWQSLNGYLPCFKQCNILTQGEKKNMRLSLMKFYPKHPGRIWIQYSQFCNQSCIMCPQNHCLKTMLDNKTLKQNIDWSNVQDIILQGGEILAITQAKDFYLWLTKKQKKKVNLITNGMLIKNKWFKYLIEGSNWIQISVNAATETTHEKVNQGSKFDIVIDNIGKLVRTKATLKSNTEIIYKYTIIPENIDEIPLAIVFAEKLGCDSIQYGYSDDAFKLLRGNQGLCLKINEKITDLLTKKKLKLKIYKGGLWYLGLLDVKIKSKNVFKEIRWYEQKNH